MVGRGVGWRRLHLVEKCANQQVIWSLNSGLPGVRLVQEPDQQRPRSPGDLDILDTDIDGNLEDLARINDVGIANLGLVGFKNIDVVEAVPG